MHKVYILFSSKLNRYYCGETADVQKRLEKHNSGGSRYTSRGIPWELVKEINCVNRTEALQLERKIKKRGIKRWLEANNS